MPMEQLSGDPKFLAGDDMRPLVNKVLMPAMLTVLGILVAKSSTTHLGLVLSGVIILLGTIQFLVIGLVKPTEECLFYRRFLRWRRIEYGDVIKFGRPIFPLFWGLHYLKLRDFEPPLGRLYFVQYHPAKPLSQHELDRDMVDLIRARIVGKKNPDLPITSPELGIKACAISAISSMFVVLFLRLLLSWPGPNFPSEIVPGQSFVYRIAIYFSFFCVHVLNWPINMVAILGLLIGIGLLQFRGHAATLSVALGVILGGIASRWFGAS
jgi:hypothetical protein